MKSRLGVTLAVGLCSLAPISAVEDPAQLCAPGTTIGDIEVERINVFDPAVSGEDRRVFRVVNAVHRPMLTRDFTVRALLTLDTGDPCTPEALDEAERALRGFRIFQDAWVTPIARNGDRVAIRVRVRDAWSTRARASFSSQGGANRTVFKLLENNLLGTGYGLSWESRSDQDRDEKNVEFTMPHIFGSRWRLAALDGRTSDGRNRVLTLERPFYRLDTRRAFSFAIEEHAADQKIYAGPEVVDRWRRDSRSAQASFGFAPRGLEPDGSLTRYALGLTWERTEWSLVDRPLQRPDLAPNGVDHLLAGLRRTWQHPRFERVSFYNTSRRVEDLDLSDEFSLGIGVPVPGFSEQQDWNLVSQLRRGLALGAGRFATFGASYTAQRIDGSWRNRLFDTHATAWFKLAPLQTLYGELRVAFGEDLEGQHRFLLGGDSGLRGYRSRAFSGSNLALLNLEHRFFAPWELLHLFRVGLVGFAEVGAIWEDDQPLGWDRVHPDVGIGLRFELLRSSAGTTLQLNAAYPLDPNGDPEEGQKLQFSILTGQGF